MSNMSYCRFQNTLSDLRDCYRYIEEPETLSEDEKGAREALIEMCREIASLFPEEANCKKSGVKNETTSQTDLCC